MKSSSAASLVVGILAGSVVTAGIMLAVGRSAPPEPPSRPERSRPAPDPALAEENRRLRKELAELKREAAAPPPVESSSPTPPSGEDAVPTPGLESTFNELLARGNEIYQSQDLVAFILRLKEKGARGREFALDILRNGKTAEARLLAATLLEGIRDPGTLPELGRLLPLESDMLVRRMISHAIALIGTDGAKGPLRTAMSGDSDWGVRVNAAYGLAKQNDAEGLKYLQEAYLSANTPAEYRLAILRGLADVAAPESAPLFRRVLEDTTELGYVMMAIIALGKMKDAESIPRLERIAASGASDIVKEAARKAIADIKLP